MEEKITRNAPIVLLDITKSYKIPFLIEQAQKRNWRFFDLNQSRRHIPKNFKIIGAITDSIPNDPFCRKLRKLDFPVVRVGQLPHPQDNLQPVVLPDLSQAGIMAAKHYASRGFKHLGFFGNDPWGHREIMFKSFLEQSKKLGLEMNLGRRKVYISIPDDIKNITQKKNFLGNLRNNELQAWLKTLPKPIGILAYNHRIASHIDLMCHSVGLSVPCEVSILCYNDVPECTMGYTQLSAIDIDNENISKQTIKLLSDIIDGNPPVESRIFIPPKKINLRQSSDILAVPDPSVAKALTFIWDNISNPISIDDIASESGIPKRTLNNSFKKHLNRTMTEELLRKRLEKACELLRNNMAVSDVITAVGISSTSYFHKRFREAYGMTPNSFRAKKQPNS